MAYSDRKAVAKWEEKLSMTIQPRKLRGTTERPYTLAELALEKAQESRMKEEQRLAKERKLREAEEIEALKEAGKLDIFGVF